MGKYTQRIENNSEISGILAGELRNKIDNLLDVFWTDGITNPLGVVE